VIVWGQQNLDTFPSPGGVRFSPARQAPPGAGDFCFPVQLSTFNPQLPLMTSSQLTGVLRHVLTALGGAGFVASDDDLARLASALVALAGVLWSIWSKSRAGAASPGAGTGAALGVAGPITLLGVGCAGMTFQQVVTPQRVQAVVTWGAYEAAREADPAARAVMTQALPGLRLLAEAPRIDGVAIAAALRAAGIDYLTTPEGELWVTTALAFADLWHDVSGKITESDYTRAVIVGVVAGLDLGLSDSRLARSLNAPGPAMTRATLKLAAEATR
jgi:hypothetical protein